MTQRSITKINKTIMDNFYKLVHSQLNIRITAASSTFKILRSLDNEKTQSEFNENLNYCIHRLVCGLASSRALARQGYGTLLIELLNCYQISTERLFTIGKDNFGQISKKTDLDQLIGYFMLISIILKTGNHTNSKANALYLEKIQQTLIQLNDCKSYFNMPIMRLAVEYHQLFPELLQKFYPEILNNKQFYKLNEVLCNAHPDILRKYLNDLINSVRNHPDKPACVKQIAYIACRPQMTEDIDIINKACRFMLLNSTFRSKVQTPTQEVVNIGDIPKVDRSPYKTQMAFKSAYHATLDHIISICKSRDRLEQLEKIISFANEVLIDNNLVYIRSDQDKTVEKLWADFNNQLRKHRKLLKKENEPSDMVPLTTLLYFYGLQIVEYGLECKTQLEELLKCCEKEEFWADIITDQLIAILSATECASWIRRICESVFGSIVPHITHTSIDLICEAIKGPENDMNSDEESDVTEDDECMSVEESDSDENNEVGENELDTSMETEINDENKEVEDIDESSVSADVNIVDVDDPEEEDDDADSEEYLNDEQMMKLDSVIADMFRLNRIGKKKKDPAFQLRCLDLVKKILRKNSNDEDVNTVLTTLIPLAAESRKLKETKPICDKIVKMLSKMPGKSRFPQVVQFLERFK